MPKAAYTLSWSAASQTYALSGPQSGEALSLIPDSPAWFAWLAEVSSFAFRGQAGSYTARLEAVQRGERYWYAYLRMGQKLRKKYLGKTADLTLARLEQVARLLGAEQASSEPTVITPAPRTAAVPAPSWRGHRRPPGRAIRSPRCWPPSSTCLGCRPGWSTAPASSSA